MKEREKSFSVRNADQPTFSGLQASHNYGQSGNAETADTAEPS